MAHQDQQQRTHQQGDEDEAQRHDGAALILLVIQPMAGTVPVFVTNIMQAIGHDSSPIGGHR